MSSDRVCRCAHPEVMADSSDCRWPAGVDVTWYLDPASVPGTMAGDPWAALEVATAIWAQSSGVRIYQVADPSLARVLISFVPIDGPWNVLGITELPCDGRADAQHTMHLDGAEAWTPDMVAQVACHEFGHALGLGHAPAGVVAVMAPIYNPDLWTLQSWDIDQVDQRYGPATLQPESHPTPTTPDPSPAPPPALPPTSDGPGTPSTPIRKGPTVNIKNFVQTVKADLGVALGAVEKSIDFAALERVALAAFLSGGKAAVLPALAAHVSEFVTDPVTVKVVEAVLGLAKLAA